MKQFNLQEYLKNPNRRIVTRNGKSVKIICTDKRDKDDYNIVALIHEKNEDVCDTFTIDGKYSFSMTDHYNDLFFVPDKKEGWINIYRSDYDDEMLIPGDSICETKEAAIKEVAEEKENFGSLVATIKIEWEE